MQWLPLSRHTAQTSPGTTRFFLSIHLPHLSYLIPCSYWASTCIAALPSCMTLYEISVRQTRDLPVVSLFPHPASFRFHLTLDTLAFGYILPTTGRIRDFNPLETCAAGRTTGRGIGASLAPIPLLIIPCCGTQIKYWQSGCVSYRPFPDHRPLPVQSKASQALQASPPIWLWESALLLFPVPYLPAAKSL